MRMCMYIYIYIYIYIFADVWISGERRAAESIIGDIMVEYRKRRNGAGADDAEPAENKAKTGSSAAAPDAVAAKEVAVMPALKAKPAAVEGKDAKTGASKAKPVVVQGKDAKTERSELERLHKPSEVWKCPYFHCGNFNPPGTFVRAGCDKDMLRYTMCRSLIEMKPFKHAVCRNRQILLTLQCYRCGRPSVK